MNFKKDGRKVTSGEGGISKTFYFEPRVIVVNPSSDFVLPVWHLWQRRRIEVRHALPCRHRQEVRGAFLSVRLQHWSVHASWRHRMTCHCWRHEDDVMRLLLKSGQDFIHSQSGILFADPVIVPTSSPGFAPVKQSKLMDCKFSTALLMIWFPAG